MLFLLFLVGFAVGVLFDILWPAVMQRCKHNYVDWKEWGVTYQQGKCSKCGKFKITGQ